MSEDQNDAANFREKMLELTQRTCDELGNVRKEIKNIYLVAASFAVIALMSSLLWFGKVDSKMFASFTFVLLFPWYGTGFERLLRLWRGEKDGQNKRDGRALGILFLIVVLIKIST